MTLKNYLKAFRAIFLYTAVVSLASTSYALAQTDTVYTPPPMFDDMTPPMVRPESKTGNIVEPKESSAPKAAPAAPQVPVSIAPRISSDPDMPQKRPLMPVPPKKPEPPKQAADVAVPTPSSAPTSTPIKEKSSAITGPKTMPALPATSVDSQVLYNGDEGVRSNIKEPTIFERHQQEAHEKTKADSADDKKSLMPVVPRPKNTANPVAFESGEQGALKKVIPFEAGQIRIPEELTNSLAAGVVKELDKDGKDGWRVQIKSYATAYGDGISSDRRIALSRALSLRSSLVTQGVAASRIDVFSEGAPSNAGAQGDRIDLYLYGQKPQ